MIGKCIKQETIAIIENDGIYFIGSNFCHNALVECPRKDMPTGVGYELCKDVCEQYSHAEVRACKDAGICARGGTLYLLGHTYCCDNCKRVMVEHGIKEVIIGRLPDAFMNKVVKV